MSNWKVRFCICLIGSVWLLPHSEIAIAQTRTANPLSTEIDKSDPVIPLGYKKRKLSAFEINRITREMEKLDRTAKAELEQGNGEKAFQLWYRQLKLARAVGNKVEIKALGDVGAIAWQANRGTDLRNIANRLITLESEAKDDLSPLLLEFATAYQQVRYLERAIAIQEQILAKNRESGLPIVEENLKTLGKLYLAQFNYQQAAQTYEQLLSLAQTKTRIDPQISFYLETLIDIYDRTGQNKQIIDASQRLITVYQTTGKLNKIPQLELAIADNHVAQKQIPEAIEAYERAFTLASKDRQLAIANNALDSLGKLYQGQEEKELAIATFNRLLDVQRQSYNYYGLVNTYDILGKIYLRLNRNKEAKQNFKQALKLAKTLNYKVKYLSSQIEKL